MAEPDKVANQEGNELPKQDMPDQGSKWTPERKKKYKRIFIAALAIFVAWYCYYDFTDSMVQGQVTWQYNRFIGTKPDVGARIVIISNNQFDLAKEIKPAKGQIVDRFIKYATKIVYADGYGKFKIDNVPAGDYTVIIESDNTTRDTSKDDEDIKRLVKYGCINSLSKIYITHISCHYGNTVTIDHDFGYTYI